MGCVKAAGVSAAFGGGGAGSHGQVGTVSYSGVPARARLPLICPAVRAGDCGQIQAIGMCARHVAMA